jgi:hypothetical protein
MDTILFLKTIVPFHSYSYERYKSLHMGRQHPGYVADR